MKRTQKQRQDEVKKIISKLTELKLTTIYEPIQQLFRLLKLYIHEEKSVHVNIHFPEIHKHIVGYLSIKTNEECWVKLTSKT